MSIISTSVVRFLVLSVRSRAFSAFHCVRVHLAHFTAFACISLSFWAFKRIPVRFRTMYFPIGFREISTLPCNAVRSDTCQCVSLHLRAFHCESCVPLHFKPFYCVLSHAYHYVLLYFSVFPCNN